MSERPEYSDIGERISSALKDAVESKEFAELNHVVTDTVNSAIEEVRRQVNNISRTVNEQPDKAKTQSYADRYRTTYKQPGHRTMRASERLKTGTAPQKNTAAQNAVSVKQETGVRIDRSSRTGGILWTVFGGIGTGVFGLMELANLLRWAFRQTAAAAVPVVVVGFLALLCGSFIGKGCRILSRLKRAERYAKLGSRTRYLELEDIARNTGSNIRKVRADVKKMLRLGIFPEGHMDRQGSCLILDDETWQQYKLTQKEWEKRKLLADKQEKAAVQEAEEQQIPETQKEEWRSQQEKICREGRAYMERLRDLNTAIPGEVISNKLFQLDYILTRIFAVLEQHPEKAPQMRRFMEYYLPTTVKLVESYAEFDKAGVQGENIRSAREEIEKTMDTINQAFEKLLDDIFLNEAMETAADAQVLKTLLAQDGYTGNDFIKKEG